MCIRLKRRGVGKKGGPGPTASDPTKRAKQDKQDNQGTRPQGTPHDQAARPTPKGRGLPKTSRAKPAAGVETPRAKTQQQAGEPAPPPPHSPKEAEPNTSFTTKASGQTGKQIRRPRKRPDYLGGHNNTKLKQIYVSIQSITIVRVLSVFLDNTCMLTIVRRERTHHKPCSAHQIDGRRQTESKPKWKTKPAYGCVILCAWHCQFANTRD